MTFPIFFDTVDGRNPAPVDRWFIPLFIGFQPSKVMQDFFHPPYVSWEAAQPQPAMAPGGPRKIAHSPKAPSEYNLLLSQLKTQLWLCGGDTGPMFLAEIARVDVTLMRFPCNMTYMTTSILLEDVDLI